MKEERKEEWFGKEEEEGWEEKWSRDPLSGVFVGLILVVIGATFFLLSQGLIPSETWWAFFLLGLGLVFLLDALIRLAFPAYRRPIMGRVLTGLILMAIGLGGIFRFENWWPLVLVVIGLLCVVYGIIRAAGMR